MTNQFRLNESMEYFLSQRWVKYDVKIFDAVRKKKKDAEGKPLEPREYMVLQRMPRGVVKEVDIEDGSVPISRRILSKLQDRLFQEKRYFCVSPFCFVE